MKTCGIYAIVNIVNGKRIIGSSNGIEARWRNYKSKLNKNKQKNPYFQSSWNKYGAINFQFVVLEECSEEELLVKEDLWMSYYKSRNKKYGYNLKSAERQMPSEESKRKMSESHKGKVFSKEHREKLSESHKEQEFSEEHRKKLSDARKGKLLSSDTKTKISNANKGRKHTEETKRKISKSRKKSKV